MAIKRTATKTQPPDEELDIMPKEEMQMLVGWLSLGLITSFWTDRNFDFYFSYFKGEEVNVPYWMSLIASFLSGAYSFIFNFIGELCRYAI